MTSKPVLSAREFWRLIVEFVVMRVADVPVAAALTDLAEIIDGRNLQVRPLPNLPSPFLGIARRCGHVIPVVDVAALMNRTGREHPKVGGQVVVMNLRAGSVGLSVDEISTIVAVEPGDIAALCPGSWSSQGLVMAHAVDLTDGQAGIIDPAALEQILNTLVPRRSG